MTCDLWPADCTNRVSSLFFFFFENRWQKLKIEVAEGTKFGSVWGLEAIFGVAFYHLGPAKPHKPIVSRIILGTEADSKRSVLCDSVTSIMQSKNAKISICVAKASYIFDTKLHMVRIFSELDKFDFIK